MGNGHLTAAGTPDPTALVCAGAVDRHIRHLLQGDATINAIARAAQVSPDTLRQITIGRRQPDGNFRKTQQVQGQVAARVLAITSDAVDVRVDATGTRRRLQGLHRLGHTRQVIAADLGLPAHMVRGLLEAQRVTRAMAQRVSATYGRLSMRPPGHPARPCDITRTRAWAARQGWQHPLAWDDDAIDDPCAVPNPTGAGVDTAIVDEVAIARRLAGERGIKLTPTEASVLVARGLSLRLSPTQIEKRSGIKATRHQPRVGRAA